MVTVSGLAPVGSPVEPLPSASPLFSSEKVIDPVPPWVKSVGLFPRVPVPVTAFWVKFRHQPPEMPMFPAPSLGADMYRFHSPLPVNVFELPPPNRRPALPSVELPAVCA